MKRLVALVALLVVLAAGVAAVATAVRLNGGLGGRYGSGIAMPVRVGAPFSVGEIELRAPNRIRIEDIRLHHAADGVVLAGARIYPLRRGMVGSAGGFPPKTPRVPMTRAVGAVLHPSARVGLVIGIRVTQPGKYRIRGIDVLYRERWH